jgi:hypothetical protein
MLRKSAKAWLSLVLLTTTGCNAIHDCVNDYEERTINCVIAQKAWNEWSWCYDDLNYPWHFSHGFKDGYENVLGGGKGCQPTLPPRFYWKPCFKTAEGQCKVAAWFDGYSHGALAAQQDGYGNMHQIPISPTAKQNLISRNAPPSAACFEEMYRHSNPDGQLIPQASGNSLSDQEMMLPESVPEALNALPESKPGALRPYDDAAEQ